MRSQASDEDEEGLKPTRKAHGEAKIAAVHSGFPKAEGPTGKPVGPDSVVILR